MTNKFRKVLSEKSKNLIFALFTAAQLMVGTRKYLVLDLFLIFKSKSGINFKICGTNWFTEIKGGSHFFSATKEGDTVLFATEDEKESRSWVAALYKSTGQSHKPAPLSSSKSSNNVNSTPNKSSSNASSTAVKR